MPRSKVNLYPTLEGHLAFVTGADRGLGAVVTAGLAAKGAYVWAGARDASSVRATRSVEPVALNVKQETSIRDALAAVRRRSKRPTSSSTTRGWPSAGAIRCLRIHA